MVFYVHHQHITSRVLIVLNVWSCVAVGFYVLVCDVPAAPACSEAWTEMGSSQPCTSPSPPLAPSPPPPANL